MPQGNLVTASTKEIKSLSLWALKGNWKTGILTSLLSTLVVNIPSLFLNWILGEETWLNVSNIYSILVTAPLSLGVIMVYLNIFRRKKVSPIEIFYGFEFLLKAILLQLTTAFLVFIQMLLFIVPGVIAVYRYSLANYILADDPTKGVFQCIRESKYLMTGNKMKLFSLTISFLGWSILASLPLSAVLFLVPGDNLLRFEIAVLAASLSLCFLEPYIQTSVAAFYELANGRLRLKRRETGEELNGGYSGYDTSQNMGGAEEKATVKDEE